MALVFFAQLGVLFLSVSAATVVSRQVQLGKYEYFVPPASAWNLQPWSTTTGQNRSDLVPITVLSLSGTADPKAVKQTLNTYRKADDVWTSSFAQFLYIQSSQSVPNKELKTQLRPEYNVSEILYEMSNRSVPPGPYFLDPTTGNAYRAYRLYVDTNQAFIQSSYQDPNGNHEPLRAAVMSAAGLTVAVPSRLYYTPTPEKPLAGVRMAIKDLFDLRGLKTSGGNRAYYEMSNIRNKTAIAVQKLIDAGVVIVGKTKLSEFAFGGMFITDHIDYLLPFNPRGDGYNSPSDSSGGSGASVAAYDWLDASMGSDTGGSVRGPAQWNGVYGNRPTHGAVDLAGIIPLSPAMDTVGLLARDPLLWSKINKVLYAGSFTGFNKYPKKLFIDPSSAKELSDAKLKHPEMATAVTKFLNHLSKMLSTKISTFSIDDAWNKSTPAAFNTTPIANAVDLIYNKLTRYEQWNKFGKHFIQEHTETHDGDFPHMVPDVRLGWQLVNASLTEHDHKGDLNDKLGVSDWVGRRFLTTDKDTCSNAIYLYFTLPSKSYKPDVSKDTSNPYIAKLVGTVSRQKIEILKQNVTISCNTTMGSKEACDSSRKELEKATASPPYSVYAGRLASVADLPDYSIPLGSFDLGETTFSDSTLKNQSLPLAVDIMAAKGCDFMILGLIDDLYDSGAIRVARAGLLV